MSEDLSKLSDEELRSRLRAKGLLKDTENGPTLVDQGLSVIGKVGRFVDTYTGAPARAGVGELIKSGNPISALGSYVSQFGEDPELAPTGSELAQQVGVSDKPMFSALGHEISPADVVGFGAEMVLDPTNLIPGTAIARGLGKGALGAAKVAGKGALEGTKQAGKAVVKVADTMTAGAATKGLDAASNVAQIPMDNLFRRGLRANIAKMFSEVPEQHIDEYVRRTIDDPDIIDKARPIEKLADDVQTRIDTLGKRAKEGSDQSFVILSKAQGRIPTGDVASLKGIVKEELEKFRIGESRSGLGVEAYRGLSQVDNALTKIIGKDYELVNGYVDGVLKKVKQPREQDLSYIDAKKFMQQLFEIKKKVEAKGGDASGINKVYSAWRGYLGEAVPEYDEVMRQVDADMRLFSDASRAFGDVNTVQNNVKNAAKFGGTRAGDRKLLVELSNAFPETGVNLLDETENRLIWEAFNKSGTRGSKNMNRFITIGDAAGSLLEPVPLIGQLGKPIGRALGTFAGTVADRKGGQLTREFLRETAVPSPGGWPLVETVANKGLNAASDLGSWVKKEASQKRTPLFWSTLGVQGAYHVEKSDKEKEFQRGMGRP